MVVARGYRRKVPQLVNVVQTKEQAKRRMTNYDKFQDREVKQLKRLVGRPEIKYTDSSPSLATGTPLTTTGFVACLNFNSQGDGPTNREGNMIKCLFVRIKGYIVSGPNEVTDRTVRLQLFWQRSPIGVNPTLYGATSTGTAAVNDITAFTGLQPNVFAPHSMEYKDEFKILYDKLKRIPISASNVQAEIPFSINMKLNRVTRFDNSPSAIASMVTNGLFFAMSVENVGAANTTTNWTARVYFVDN